MHLQRGSFAEQTYCFLALLLGRFSNDDGDGNEIVNLKEKSCRFLYSPQVYVFFYQVLNGTVRGSAACASTGARRLRYKRINIGMPGKFSGNAFLSFFYEKTLRKGLMKRNQHVLSKPKKFVAIRKILIFYFLIFIFC